MAMNLSLSKVPWYGQVGAFVALSLAAAGAFWNWYARDAQASIELRQGQRLLDVGKQSSGQQILHPRAGPEPAPRAGDATGAPLLAGSGLLAAELASEGRAANVRLVVSFQQVGDADLRIARDLRSHRLFREEFWLAAARLGRTDAFRADDRFESPVGSHTSFVVAGFRGEIGGLEARPVGDGFPLQVDHLEAQDRREPGPERGLAPEAADALQRGHQGLLHGLLGKLGVAQLRKRVADQVRAVALDFREARVGHGGRFGGDLSPKS